MSGNVEDWNLYRALVTIARAGTLAAAAEELGTSVSTVHRKLAELEDALGTRLFERRGRVRALTAVGEAIAQRAARLEEDVRSIERQAAGQDRKPSGRVVVTTTDSLAEAILMPCLTRLRVQYPDLHLDVLVDNRHFRLGRGEADLALRAGGRTNEPDVVARPVGDVFFSHYASRAYLARHGRPKRKADLLEHDAVVVDESLAQVTYGRVARERTSPSRHVLRTPSLSLQATAVEQGLGIAALPCFLMHGRPGVVRLFRPEPEAPLHVLFHRDHRGTARVRAVMDALTDFLAEDRALLSGAVVAPRRRGRARGG